MMSSSRLKSSWIFLATLAAVGCAVTPPPGESDEPTGGDGDTVEMGTGGSIAPATGGSAPLGTGGAASGGTDPGSGGTGTGGTNWDDPTLPGYTLEWSDEFNVDGPPDSAHWNILEWEAGHTNMELQQYTNRTENLRVENGVLVIEARLDNFDGSPYSSGRVFGSGKKDILYGRIDVRAKLPAGRGTWPAIWMMPTSPVSYGDWPNSGEIDIMEHVGYDMNVVHSAVHTESFNWQLGSQKTSSIDVSNVATEFHVYRLDWTAEGLFTYVDNVPLFQFANAHAGSATWPFDKPFHLILNIAIGGNWGGLEGIDDSIFPQKMEVDYVRVYKPE